MLVGLVPHAVGAPEARPLTNETILDSSAFDADARLIDLKVDRVDHSIGLDDRDMVEDDSPASGRGPDYIGQSPWSGDRADEKLRPGIVIRKVLTVADPRAFQARLVFLALERPRNTIPLNISVNGTRLLQPGHHTAKKQYYGDGSYRFYYVSLPDGVLKQGENDIRMWVDEATTDSRSTSWSFLISLDELYPIGTGDPKAHHPNHSFKSSDGGRAWTDSKLGALDSADGEYGIRLAFERYIKAGQMESAVVDTVGGLDPFKRIATGIRVTGDVASDIPANTSLKLMARSGSSPDPETKAWSDWQSIDPTAPFALDSPGRYVQFKAEFETKNPLVTPRLRSIRLKAEWQQPASANQGAGLVVKAIHNGRVLRSSIPYEYENLDHSELKRFREQFKLDDVVAGANGEFDAMMRLLRWAYRIPVDENSGMYDWDPFKIVKFEPDAKGNPRLQMNYKGRRRDAMCLLSNLALIYAFESMGYQARHVIEHTIGMSGHEVVEVWSNEFNKWIEMDATRDYYYFDPDTGTPLDLLEIHNRLAAAMPGPMRHDRPFPHEALDEVSHRVRIGWRQGVNSVSITTDALHLVAGIGYLRYIPRNNFVSKPYPLPPAHGYTEWGWNGFVNYYDSMFPRRPEYLHNTDRVVDYHEPLNQAELTVNETATAGQLDIETRTMTPGFDAYYVRLDDGEWVRQSKPAWNWYLHPGMNQIDVRVRTTRGIFGPISSMRATYYP